jgi:hypothetical protein
MNTRQRFDSQRLISLGEVPAAPRLQWMGIEPVAPRPICSLFGGDHRRRTVQFSAGDPVEVVAMQMRQDHGVEGRQISGLAGRLGEPSRPQPAAEVCPLPAVQEVRVGEHGEGAQPDQRGRVADEGDAVHGRPVPGLAPRRNQPRIFQVEVLGLADT